MANVTCPLCGKIDNQNTGSFLHPCEKEARGIRSGYTCGRCGGFDLDHLVELTNSEGLEPEVGLRLSCMARLYTDRDERLAIARNFNELADKASEPKNFSEYFDRVLGECAKASRLPGRKTDPKNTPAIAARTFLPLYDLSAVLGHLSDAGLVKVDSRGLQQMSVTLTMSGWKRADELRRSGPQSNRAFVAMSFANEMRTIYEDGIRPALVDSGYEAPFRVDDPEHDEQRGKPEHDTKIDDRILAGIRRARFVVVEVTGNRNSVYYEAGFADGLAVPTLYCCRAGAENDMAFDTRQIEHIVWTDALDLRGQLTAKIGRHGWRLT